MRSSMCVSVTLTSRIICERLQADVNMPDPSGQSPLHIASANGNLELTALLLEHNSAANQVATTCGSWVARVIGN